MRFITDAGQLLPVIAVAFLASAAIAYVLTPAARRLALRRGFIDRPSGRRVNTRPIPRAGGIAIAVAFIAVAAAVILLDGIFDVVPLRGALDGFEIAALLVGGALATLLGYLDDALQLRARWQMGGQLLLAIGAVALGITVPFVNNPIGPGLLRFEGLVAVTVTVFWIVGMINSINFIDGLDGLSSGIGAIAAVTLGIISLTTTAGAFGQPVVAVLCFVLAGALVGFLRWNWHPASVFAGTSGIQFVGYTLAILAILGSAKVAVALLVLGIPIIDTFWIIVRRVIARRSPFSPDRGHIHHRLLGLGLTHRQAVVLIFAICAALAVLSLVLSGSGTLYAFLGLAVGFGVVLFVLTRAESTDALDASTYNGGDGSIGQGSNDQTTRPTDGTGPAGGEAVRPAPSPSKVLPASSAMEPVAEARDDDWRAPATRSKAAG